jgi:sulfur transfer protein SufE
MKYSDKSILLEMTGQEMKYRQLISAAKNSKNVPSRDHTSTFLGTSMVVID